MAEDTCTFDYIRSRDTKPVRATGIERSWMDLKLELGREGEGIPGAKYYKKISPEGPDLFAVKPDQTVWYHDAGKWQMYQTATNVKFDIFHAANMDPRNSTFASTTDNDDPKFSEQDGNQP